MVEGRSEESGSSVIHPTFTATLVIFPSGFDVLIHVSGSEPAIH